MAEDQIPPPVEVPPRPGIGHRQIAKAVEHLLFGKAERMTAGICMGIPFFLLVARWATRDWWCFPALALSFILLPFGVTWLTRSAGIRRENHGLFITVLIGLILLGLYFLFTRGFGFISMDSISAYVTIRDSFIFGMLLTIAAMLFMANGLLYSNESLVSSWRAPANLLLGLMLLGVVIFPCTKWPVPHYICAVLFFGGCAVSTALRRKGTAKTKHSVTDYFTAALMLSAFAILILKDWKVVDGKLVDWINLFGAESIGLWVIGTDFILVSLRRLTEGKKKGPPLLPATAN